MNVTRFQEYWNDEGRERSKPYWVEQASDRKLLRHLQDETNLQKCFEDALDFACTMFDAVRGTVLDLGAGVCWTTALISRHPDVSRVVAYDYSAHRLRIAPVVFRQFAAAEAKIELRCQPMCPLPHEDGSIDLVVFCQSLYMSEDPHEVMSEAVRVLRPGGVVVIACEQIEAPMHAARLLRELRDLAFRPRRAWGLVTTGRLVDESGRCRYLAEDYAAIVERSGLQLARQPLDYSVFKTSLVPAENFFGRKLPKEND